MTREVAPGGAGPATSVPSGTPSGGEAGARGAALDALRATLDAAAAERLGVVQLRHKPLDEATAFDGNDYDFLMEPRDHGRLVAIVHEEAKRRGVSFLVDEADPAKTHVQFRDAARRASIEVDFWKEHGVVRPDSGVEVFVRFRDLRRCLIDAAGGTWDRAGAGGGAPRLPADLEYLLYVCHLETRHKDLAAPAVTARLAHYRGAALAEPHAFLPDEGRRERMVARLDALEDTPSLADAALDSLRTLQRGGLPLRTRRREDDPTVRVRNALRRRIEARLHHPVLAFVGPDGSGKSTIIEALRADPATTGTLRPFKHFFRMTRPYAAVTRAHPYYRRLDDNVADERLGALWFAVALAQYFREMRPSPEEGRVLVDRYFHDLLLRDVRAPGRTARLSLAGRFGRWLFPLPDAVVQLYAPRETLRARKQELSPENLEIYGKVVDDVYARRSPRMLAVVSTAAPIEECVEFLRIVLHRVGDGARPERS